MSNHPNRSQTANTHIVLWNAGARPGMHVVCEDRADGVSYSRNFSDRLKVTAEGATKLCEKIRKLYGASQDLVIVRDEDGFDSEKKRDKFLPAWAYMQKYDSNSLVAMEAITLAPGADLRAVARTSTTVVDGPEGRMQAAFEAKYQRDWNDPSGNDMKAIWSDAWVAATTV